MTMLRRLLACFGLVAILSLAPSAAKAQAPAPEGGEEAADDSLYGYIGTGLFAAVAIFALCKSSRR